MSRSNPLRDPALPHNQVSEDKKKKSAKPSAASPKPKGKKEVNNG
jgi:hypothetical protein